MKIDKVCIIGIFFSLFLLTGCGSDESEPSTPPGPDKEAIRNMILRHSKLQIQYRGEFAGMREMRKHVAWYTKGLTGAADLRRRVNETETLDELMMLLEEL